MKKCLICKIEKPFTEFYNKKNSKDGYYYWCKSCNSKISQKWQKNNIERHKANYKKWRKKNRKKINIRQNEWNKNHREKYNLNQRIWYKNNSTKSKNARKKWQKNNPDKVKKIRHRYNKKCYATIKGNLDSRMTSAIYQSIRQNKAGRHWETLVGYTVDDLKKHLELQFLKGMNWNNIHLWHIDHITPKSFFIYEKPEDQEFQYCWSLNNLQPLWWRENISKGNKVLTQHGGLDRSFK